MDWIILIVLVPAVIVPVVLLFGFAGCQQLAGIETITIVPREDDKSKLPFPLPKWAWNTIYAVPLSEADTNVEVQPLTGRCLVQVIPMGPVGLNLRVAMQVTVRASSSMDLTIKRFSVSLSKPGGDLWDSEPPPTMKIVEFPLGLTVKKGMTNDNTKKSEALEVNFVIEDEAILNIAFDVQSGEGLHLKKVPTTGGSASIKPNSCAAFIKLGEYANIGDRTWPLPGGGDPNVMGGIVLIEKIEVLGN